MIWFDVIFMQPNITSHSNLVNIPEIEKQNLIISLILILREAGKFNPTTVKFQIEDALLLNFSNFGARFYSKISKFYVVKFL